VENVMVPEKLLKTSQVAELQGVSSRTIFDHVRAGKFPKPDFPAMTRGAPDRWKISTIERHREEQLAPAIERPHRRRATARRSLTAVGG
jgi:predicted DNA-binding transcriptional regulator AlpA